MVFPLEQAFEEAFALGGLQFFLVEGMAGGGCQLGTGNFVAEVEVFFESGHFQVLVGGGDGHGEGEVVPVGVGGAGEAELHEFAVDGECHGGALPEADGVEVDVGVVGADAYADDEAGGVSDEPAIDVVLGGACLAGDFSMQPVVGAEGATGAFVHDGGEDVAHDVGFFGGHGFPSDAGFGAVDDFAVAVPDFREVVLRDEDAVVGECHEGIDHFLEGNVRHAECHGGVGGQVGSNAEAAGVCGDGVDAGLHEDFDGDGVDGFAEGAFEGVVAVVAVVGVAGCPVVVFGVAALFVGVVGVEAGAVAEGGSVDDGFEDGADLAGGGDLVVLEVFVVRAADPGFYFAGLRLYGDEGGLEYLQVVLDGVDGGVFDAFFPVVGVVDEHRFLAVHFRQYFFFAAAFVFEGFVDAAVADGILQDVRVFVPRFVSVEVGGVGFLYAGDVGFSGFFGVLLHFGVEGGGEEHAVGVEVVVGAVFRVVCLNDAQGVLPDAFAEVRGGTAVVGGGVVVQTELAGFVFLSFGFSEEVVFHHLVDDGVASPERPVGMEAGVVVGGAFEHADEGGCLGERQFGGGGGEVFLRGTLQPEGVFPEGDGVEVKGEDFFFVVDVFQAAGGEHFLEFHDGHESHLLLFARVEVFCQLLAEGAASAGAPFAEEEGLEEDAQHTDAVYSLVLVETDVFGGEEGVDGIGGNVFEVDVCAVFDVVFAYQHAFLGAERGGFGVADVLEVAVGWQLAPKSGVNGVDEQAQCRCYAEEQQGAIYQEGAFEVPFFAFLFPRCGLFPRSHTGLFATNV